MTSDSPSPHPNSTSPTRPTAFQWPVPAQTICVREIIEKYYPNNQELLKHVLIAKAEEDRKQTAQDVLKTEQARIHLRQIELELMREQSRVATLPLQQGYYSLAPVQQQVLARITGSTDNQYHPPASPVAAYPHSAHPLCPPENRLNPPRQYHLHPTTPISPHDENRKRKQQHSLPEEDKLSHNKVMEALKAKIQRGSSSPLATTAPNSAFLRDNHNKKQRTLPKPIIEPTQLQQQPSTPSPRSAKPILPPIDTTIGRIPTTHLPSHPLISPTATTVRDTTTNES